MKTLRFIEIEVRAGEATETLEQLASRMYELHEEHACRVVGVYYGTRIIIEDVMPKEPRQ